MDHHERWRTQLRVNADGVFATVRLTVVAGNAHGLITDMDEGLTVRAGEPQDLFIQVVDVHGNIAESTSVTTSLDSTLGELEASPTGLGYWQFTGKRVGDLHLRARRRGATPGAVNRRSRDARSHQHP